MKPFIPIKPDTYHKSFFLAAFISAIAAGLAIEIHDRNPFNIYRKPEKNNYDTVYNISVTIILTGCIAYVDYWIARILFGFGDSTLVI